MPFNVNLHGTGGRGNGGGHAEEESKPPNPEEDPEVSTCLDSRRKQIKNRGQEKDSGAMTRD